MVNARLSSVGGLAPVVGRSVRLSARFAGSKWQRAHRPPDQEYGRRRQSRLRRKIHHVGKSCERSRHPHRIAISPAAGISPKRLVSRI